MTKLIFSSGETHTEVNFHKTKSLKKSLIQNVINKKRLSRRIPVILHQTNSSKFNYRTKLTSEQ